MLSKINKHLKLIKQNSQQDFGGINMVLYGDPCQLGPIFDKYIFEPNNKDPYGAIAGGSLFENFSCFTLEEIVRQKDMKFQLALSDLADGSSAMTPSNIQLFKSRETLIENLINVKDRIDLFSENKEVSTHNNTMIDALDSVPFIVKAKLSLMGDEPKNVKKKVIDGIHEKDDFRQTVGLRLEVIFKVGGRYFLPINISLNDGLVNGAIGTLMQIDLDQQKSPITMWILFDNPNIGQERRRLLAKCVSCASYIKNGWTPIFKICRSFPTSRKRLTGLITMFPLYYAYSYTICKSQGNNNIGIQTVVHLSKSKRVSRKEMYVALSRTDKLENLFIVGHFQDPWEFEEKSKGIIREDEVRNGFLELEKRKLTLSWTPLYLTDNNAIKISFFNVNSLRCHLADVNCDYSLLASDILFFIDTRLYDNEQPKIHGFSFVGQQSMENEYHVPGGVCVYAKNKSKVTKLNTKLVSEKNYFANILTCSIQKLRVICIYFSPHCPINLKRKLIATEICMFRNDEEIIVGGDFNQEKDLDILIENGFRRGTIEHTTNLGTSIDHLYFKNILNIEFGRNRKYYSDHCNLFVIIQSEQSFKSKTLLRVNNSKFDNLMDQTRISNPTDISSLTNNSNRLLEPAIPRLSNTSGFYQAWVIDRLNTQSSIGLIHFMKYLKMTVINKNGNCQKGNSCGYIVASCAAQFFEMFSKGKCPSQHNQISYEPDVVLMNFILGLSGDEARLLESTQLIELITHLTNDHNMEWFYIMDVNLFRKSCANNFQGINFKQLNNFSFAIFAVNDAILSDDERLNLWANNKIAGNHWYTVVVQKV